MTGCSGAWDPLEVRFLDEETAYDGTQIGAHWAYLKLGVRGDSAVAFIGPCEVRTAALVDLADAKEGLFIRSKSMLHFIVEHFDRDLEKGVLRQRLFAAIVRDEAARMGAEFERRGDDLYLGDGRKASVSIAAPTPVSVKMHFGINVDPAGAPVPAAGLIEFGIDPRRFAVRILDLYRQESAGVYHARCKVRLAGEAFGNCAGPGISGGAH